MENYKNLVLQNEIGNIQMIRPIKGGESIIDTYPLDVIERLGKYQFIYDYSANSSTSSYNMNNWVNFSKGDVVEVVRFQLGSAIINNPNYKDYSLTSSPAPDTSVKPKWDWGQVVAGFGNKKELEIPKEYLQKVDDSNSVTIPTGVNFGANPKPQPISIKPIGIGSEPSSDVILEENATFSLVKPFTYVTSYTKGRPLYELGGAGMLQYVQTPNYETIPAGTKVTGRLFKSIANQKVISAISGVSNSMIRPTVIEKDFLAVKGFGSTGSINIPIEYLTREVSTNTNNNNGKVVPVANDNKNLLMIVGAFLVGYVLFSKETPST
jgi:putative transposon-encoded protein